MIEITVTPLVDWHPDQIKKLSNLIRSTGWNEDQVQGQLEAAKRFVLDKGHSVVFLAEISGGTVGFISAQFYSWNRLAQIHGLIAHPDFKRRGIASKLVQQVEAFMRAKSARGIYVDTPTNNISGRKFYESLHYKEDYIMTDYYDEGSDGVTYLKLFKWEKSKEKFLMKKCF